MIRVCPPNQIVELAGALGEKFFRSANEPSKINPDYYGEFWRVSYLDGSGVFFIEEDEDGVVKGFLGLVFYPEIWTGEMTATEVCWYSEGKEGLKLLEVAEQTAKAMGCTIMYVNHINNPHSARVATIYKRKGYHLGYERYMKEL